MFPSSISHSLRSPAAGALIGGLLVLPLKARFHFRLDERLPFEASGDRKMSRIYKGANPEYYDHCIRDEDELSRTIRYRTTNAGAPAGKGAGVTESP